MATLKLTIVPAKVSKNGTHKIRVAIGHHQETRYIVTPYCVNKISAFKNGQVIGSEASIVNTKLRNLLNHYQELLDQIDTKYYSCSQLREYLQSKPILGVSVMTLLNKVISGFELENRYSYAKLYKRSIEYFIEMTNGDLMFQIITPNHISKFEKYLISKGLNQTSTGIHISHLKALINIAKKEGIVKYEIDPFTYYIKPHSNERELDITIDEFKLIRNSVFKEKSLSIARDLFCLSYYMGGINLIDLMNADLKGNTIDYIREKTKNRKKGDKRISITIQPEAKEIINRWINNGKLDFGYNFKFEYFRNYITKNIQKMADKLGIEKRVVYYSARKSFVQHGFEAGIPLEILEYCIGQSVKQNRPIFNYIKFMRKHADEAIRKILDNLK